MNHNPPPGPLPGNREQVIDACAHLDAAASLIDSAHFEDPFHPNRSLAAQISLLAGAIHPGIQAVPAADDPWGAVQHLDHALVLLDALSKSQITDDLRRYREQLTQLREAVAKTDAGRAEGGK